jgi:hypothetical protein
MIYHLFISFLRIILFKKSGDIKKNIIANLYIIFQKIFNFIELIKYFKLFFLLFFSKKETDFNRLINANLILNNLISINQFFKYSFICISKSLKSFKLFLETLVLCLLYKVKLFSIQ